MFYLWLVTATAVLYAASVMADISDILGAKLPRRSITLDLNGTTSPTGVTQFVEDGVRSYVVKDEFSHVIGDVIFGDRVVYGNSSYTLRTVHTDLSGMKKVLKVRTVHIGVGNLIEEFIETEPDSDKYETLERVPISLDLGDTDIPEPLYTLYDPDKSATRIYVNKQHGYEFRIGRVLLLPNVVDDQTCVGRTVSIWRRLDGKRLVLVETSLHDETVKTDAFIEATAGKSDFVPAETDVLMADCDVVSIPDDFDLDDMSF
ncbi:putative membrane protein [Babesia divergens]|uniref:Membrane protein n=1 Tax=Babesia divergens TaxID=32595 RepID=A0AAD9G6P2_BABDI|nr:putative membrane protein [Babesia divergens]